MKKENKLQGTQKKDKCAPKLSDHQKQVVIRMLGAYCSPREIKEYLQSEYEVTLNDSTITFYKKQRRKEILKAREGFLNDIEVLPVSDKAYRIKQRQDLVNDLRANLWAEVAVIRDGKLMLDKNGKPKKVKTSPQHFLINKILDSIQNELDPIKINIDHTVRQQLELAKEKAITIAKELCEN